MPSQSGTKIRHVPAKRVVYCSRCQDRQSIHPEDTKAKVFLHLGQRTFTCPVCGTKATIVGSYYN